MILIIRDLFGIFFRVNPHIKLNRKRLRIILDDNESEYKTLLENSNGTTMNIKE